MNITPQPGSAAKIPKGGSLSTLDVGSASTILDKLEEVPQYYSSLLHNNLQRSSINEPKNNQTQFNYSSLEVVSDDIREDGQLGDSHATPIKRKFYPRTKVTNANNDKDIDLRSDPEALRNNAAEIRQQEQNQEEREETQEDHEILEQVRLDEERKMRDQALKHNLSDTPDSFNPIPVAALPEEKTKQESRKKEPLEKEHTKQSHKAEKHSDKKKHKEEEDDNPNIRVKRGDESGEQHQQQGEHQEESEEERQI